MNTNFLIAASAFVLVICALAYYILTNWNKDPKKLAELERQYKDAIAKKDKQLILEIGRKYYAAKRGGELSIYDEQAIANDLASIQ